MSQSTCPGCGVSVTSGYTRCPRCHAAMPSARMRRESLLAGGTSVAPEATGGGIGWWIAIGLVVVGGAIALVVVLSGGGGRAAPPSDPVDPDRAAIAPAPTTAPPDPPVPPVRLDPLGALDRLERVLATERLYGKGTVRGEVVELRSELCSAARLRAIVLEKAGDLRAQGLTSLRCVEPHGAEVFTQPL
jgi:hypothetical protein